MQYCVIDKKAEIPRGTIMVLSADQAAARQHALENIGKGRFKLTAATEFKRGEKVAIIGKINKELAGKLMVKDLITESK